MSLSSARIERNSVRWCALWNVKDISQLQVTYIGEQSAECAHVREDIDKQT